jgi:hypothetical protein
VDPNLLDPKLSPLIPLSDQQSIQFHEINGRHFHHVFASTRKPFMRVISHHANCAIKKAVAKRMTMERWIRS